MSRKVLKIEDHSDYNFMIAGIVTGLRDYKLCFELNRNLGLNLGRMDDLSLNAGRPGASTSHALFEYHGPDDEQYLLVHNRDSGNTGFFIPEMRNVDFFLLVSHPPPELIFKDIITVIRNISHISGVYDIKPESVKSINNFLFLVEE